MANYDFLGSAATPTVVRTAPPGADGQSVDMVTEVDPLLDIEDAINELREKRNAVILAHYYQEAEIQDIADHVGDSLDLSRKAAATDAEVIVFAGVRFMAEVAKIVNPTRTVVLPDAEAGCSLEDSCPPDRFEAFLKDYPDHLVLSYINCSAEVKALSDIIVTSTNAEAIIRQIPKDRDIVFAPDRHLGGYLAKVAERDMVLWPGSCIVHERFSERELIRLKGDTPGAPVLAHPECPDAILKHADHVGSTSSILKYASETPAQTLIVVTEPHIMHQMELRSPGKTFIGAPGADGECNCNNCPFMELNTMEKLYLSLANLAPRIEIPEDLRLKALAPLERMFEMSANVGSSIPAVAAAE